MCCRWVIRCLIRRLFDANVHIYIYIYIYMLLDNTYVGYPGIEKFSVGGPPATSFRRRLPEEVTLSGA